ncbi:MAG TPA: HWE histidine kinase domain-containing protein [Rhodopila sp.]|jgi:PAS domain S-box-containing protein
MGDLEHGLEWFSKRLIEILPAAVYVCNADAVIVAFNERATQLWGRSPRPGQTDEKFCGSHKLFWPDGRYLPHEQTSMGWVLQHGKPWNDQEAIVERPDGSRVPVLLNVAPIFDDSGKQIGAVNCLQDLTALKRAEAEREQVRAHAAARQSLLLGELSHRVKNTLAVVQSIAAQTHMFAPPEQFYDAFAARLEALAKAHDLLRQSEWEGAELADAVRLGFAPYEAVGHVQRWTITGPGISLAPNEAMTLSLAFHELATNAAKFGALSDPAGKIDVGWTVNAAGQAPCVEIRWLEHGGPTVAPPSGRGFGSRLLERAIVLELGGDTRLDFAATGVECRIRLPLSPRIMAQTGSQGR